MAPSPSVEIRMASYTSWGSKPQIPVFVTKRLVSSRSSGLYSMITGLLPLAPGIVNCGEGEGVEVALEVDGRVTSM